MPGIKAKRKQLVRKTLMRAKAQSERPAEQRQESPEEYAQTEVQQGILRCGCPYRQHRQKHRPHELPQVSCNAGEAEKSHLAGQHPICIEAD